MGFKLFAHPADIGIKAWGKTLEEAFAWASIALTAIVSELNLVEPKEKRILKIEADDLEFLLFDFLNEVIFLMSKEKLLFSKSEVQIEKRENFLLEATLRGEKIEPTKHRPCVEVKGVSWYELEVNKVKDKWVIKCIVDV